MPTSSTASRVSPWQRSLQARVQIAKKDLALDDDSYRDLLERVTGKRSTVGMGVRGLQAVIAELRAKGWTDKPAPRHGRKPRVKPGAQGFLSRLEALLADNGRPWSYAEGIAQRMFGVERLEWCDESQIKAVMVALVQDARRRAGREDRT